MLFQLVFSQIRTNYITDKVGQANEGHVMVFTQSLDEKEGRASGQEYKDIDR